MLQYHTLFSDTVLLPHGGSRDRNIGGTSSWSVCG